MAFALNWPLKISWTSEDSLLHPGHEQNRSRSSTSRTTSFRWTNALARLSDIRFTVAIRLLVYRRPTPFLSDE